MVDSILSSGVLSQKQKIDLISFLGLKKTEEGDTRDNEIIFDQLKQLIHKTVAGAKVDHLNPEISGNGFRVIMASSEDRECLGSLHVIFNSNPIPYYFLVYVEVASLFRRTGLGARMLKTFGNFLNEKNSIGILDNIIPEDDPAYNIYKNNGWSPVADFLGRMANCEFRNYMIYIPPKRRAKKSELKANVLKRLLIRLIDRRDLIDMRSNSLMVKETIKEFKSLYDSLIIYYQREISDDPDNEAARYAFTKFASLLVSFRRKIEDLIGYTGGESLEEIHIGEKITGIKIKSYPIVPVDEVYEIISDNDWDKKFPDALLDSPTRFIERLPLYPRPYFKEWQKETRKPEESLTIGDLIDIGFDPTRLKLMDIADEKFIVERVSIKAVNEIIEVKKIIDRIVVSDWRESKIFLDTVKTVCILKTESAAYVFRKMVEGIHLDEAVEMLSRGSHLEGLAELKIDLMLKSKVATLGDFIANKLDMKREDVFDKIAFFVPWDLEKNSPKLIFCGTMDMSLEKIWVA